MPEVGDNLGRYTLLKRLASGGMGEVFLAAKPGPVGFGPYVALKVLRDELACDQQFVDMLVDEANISMFLNHQNVVTVLDLAEDRGSYYIAMEYVQGITVERLVDSLVYRGKRLPIPHGLFIAAELCRALKYAHTRVNHAGEPLNIIHRDVTPANILLSVQGEVKLTDFGIARARGRVHQTQAGVLKGKFGYMAPEMIRYEAIDARADLFCAGVVAYLMVSGQHPVAGASVMDAIQRFEEKRIPPPSQINPEVPKSLDTIVMRALEPRPEQRWTSAAGLGEALQDVMLQNPVWRREAKDGPQRLAQLIREVAPESFEEPVSRETLEHLLRRARDAERRREGGGPRKARASLMDTAKAPAPHVEPAGSDLQELIDLPTATAMPAVDAEVGFGATPVGVDRETDESLSADSVRAARDEIAFADTDERGAEEDEDTEGQPVADATTSYAAVDRLEVGVEVAFPDTSTDRGRLRAQMAEEPALPVAREASDRDLAREPTIAGFAYDQPAYDEPEIDRPLGPSGDQDVRTVVAYDPEEELEDELPVGSPTEAGLVVRLDDSKTVAGLEVPDWEQLRATADRQAISSGATPEEDAATIIPTDEGLPDADLAALLASAPWVRDTSSADPQDATILDGIDARQVQAAMAAALRKGSDEAVTRAPEGPGVRLVRDESRARSNSNLDMDQIVADSLDSGPVPLPPSGGPKPEAPRPFAGPIRIVMGADGAPQIARTSALPAIDPVPSRSAAEILAASAQPVPKAPGRGVAREKNRTPPDGVPSTPAPNERASALDVGNATGRWMAGELEAGALEWSDEAAARRAVATRNKPSGTPARATPTPAPSPQPSLSPPPPWSPPAATPRPRPAQPGFFSRNGLVLGTTGVALALCAGLVWAWFFSALFWPKLKLDSEPQGAQVRVDGAEIAGATPLMVPVEPGKRHLIELRSSGYKRALREISEGIGRGRTYTLRVPLELEAPIVHLPVPATVLVNGRPMGRGTRVELADLPPTGAILLRVEAEGHRPYELTFDKAGDVPASLDVPLTKSNGS